MKEDIQSVFFDQIKQRADHSISFVDQVADLLSISNDSAYRRLRGETAISLEEASILARHFGISLEEIGATNPDNIMFGRSTFRDQTADFDLYLKKTAAYLDRIVNTKQKKGIYAAKDIPVFHYFQIPEVAQFKLFFWLKTIRASQSIDALKFDFNSVPIEMIQKARSVCKNYFLIPFAEIWNEDTIHTLIRQINYFFEAGWMANKNVALQLCDHAAAMIRVIEQQSESGLKWWDGKPVHPDVPFELYYNDLIVLDNSMFVETDQFQMSMIGYNAMDYLYTFHPGFCREEQHFLQKQIGKSMLLSGASEKERNKFFNKIYEKIDAQKAKMAAG